MKNKVINIIRPVEYGAEKDYLKEFFRFIGCFLSDRTVDEYSESSWLKPSGEENSVDILINYFGKDPYRMECSFRGIKRIYCYFSFDKLYGSVEERPLETDMQMQYKPLNKAVLRRNVLANLICAIWSEDPDICKSVSNIAMLYTENSQGDMFYYLQVKRSLRFLSMSEVLNEPNAYVAQIALSPYIQHALEGLWEMYTQLENSTDSYSYYAQIKAACFMRQIVQKLNENDWPVLEEINYQGKVFQLFSEDVLIDKLHHLIYANPQFISAYLCMAGLCRNAPEWDHSEENCYLQILQSITNGRREYAFIWYRIGYYFEKKYGNHEKALDYYQMTAKVDPDYYQALFKLGYYAAVDGRFKEAEALLNRALTAIFHGRSPEPDENGMYNNWNLLSLKESQYVFKAYMLLAKIAINSNREYSAKAFVGKACIAATCFEEASLVSKAATQLEMKQFWEYHGMSAPVWAIWQILRPWSDGIIEDRYVRNIVNDRLSRWQQS